MLAKQHPNADTELDYRNAFELLVATILSAQSTDARVNIVTPALFARYPDAAALAAVEVAELEPQIVSTGFFRQKSKALVGMARQLVADHDGVVPANLEALTALPGVGRKTANVVLGHALARARTPRRSSRVARGDPHRLSRQARPRRRSKPSCATTFPSRCGPWRQTSRSCMVAASAGQRLAATRVTCALTATTISVWVRRGLPVVREPNVDLASETVMTRAQFERLVVEAIALVPRRFRREMQNLALVVEDEPNAELLEEMEVEPPDSLYGLYQGTPLPERTWAFGNSLPDRITLFQRPIEVDCDDEDEVRAVIGETLIHEVGHYFGLSEEEIEEIEERYWRGDTLGSDEDDE